MVTGSTGTKVNGLYYKIKEKNTFFCNIDRSVSVSMTEGDLKYIKNDGGKMQ